MNSVLKEDFDRILSRVTPRFKELAGSNLLITGAAGFIGSYLMDLMSYANEHYFERAVRVVGVDNWVAASRLPTLSEHMVLARNLLDHRVEWAIHAASIASPQLYLAKPLETLEANVNLTRRVLEWSTQAKGIVYLSTSEVYGDTAEVPTPETCVGSATFSTPRAVYHESKRYAELLCQVYHRQFGVPVKIVRPFYVYGPGENLANGRLVPQLMRAALGDSKFTVYGGEATRSLCYIADAVEQFLLVLLDGQPSEAYNVGALDEVAVNAIVYTCKRLFKLEVTSISSHETLTADAPSRRAPDLRKITALGLGCPFTSLGAGLDRTYRYYKEQRDRP